MTTETKKGLYHGCSYDLLEVPAVVVQRTEENSSNLNVLKWSGKQPIPSIGRKVAINFNQLGTGKVVAYFWEHGYLGLIVKLDKAPEWHRLQKSGTKYFSHVLVFGVEVSNV